MTELGVFTVYCSHKIVCHWFASKFTSLKLFLFFSMIEEVVFKIICKTLPFQMNFDYYFSPIHVQLSPIYRINYLWPIEIAGNHKYKVYLVEAFHVAEQAVCNPRTLEAQGWEPLL